MAAYAEIGSENELLIQTSTPRRFLLVDRKKVSNPPPTWSRLVPAGASTSIGTFNETQEQREASDWDLSGTESVSIPVESNRDSDRQRPDAPVGDDGSSPTIIASATDSSDAGDSAADGDDDDSTEVMVSRMPTRAEIAAAPNFTVRSASILRLITQDPDITGAITPSLSPAPSTEPTLTPAKSSKAKKSPAPVSPVTPAVVPTPTPTPSAEAGAANIARPSGRWIQKTSADFGRGTFDGTLVDSSGTIHVGPKNTRLVSSAEPVAWSIATDGKGVVYLGTGHSARLLKVENGVSKVIYEGPEVAVSALALDNAGNLYAGVSPGGRVLRFRPDGSHEMILQTEQDFVHALAFDGSGNLIVATGGESGAIYRIPTPATRIARTDNPDITSVTKPFAILPQKHVRSLAVSGDSIYAGTAEDAILYRIDNDGKVTALYQATGSINSSSSAASTIDSLLGGNSTVVLGGPGAPNPNTAIILGGGSGVLPTGAGAGPSGNEILSLAMDGANVYFGTATSGSIFRWNASTGVQEVFKVPGRAVYALKMVGTDLYAGTGETGEVWRISNLSGDVSGARVLDTNQPQVLALANVGNEVFAATGNNAAAYEIGGTGTDTFTSNVFDAGQVVRFGTLRALATGANFEFRSGNTLEPDASWSSWKVVDNGESLDVAGARYAQYRVKLGESGTVSRVEVAFRAPNRTPKLVWTSPAGDDFISGKKSFTWSGTDPDKDPLRYKLDLIDATGKVQSVDLTTATAASQEVDTKKFSDGVYRARVSGSDATRNPEDPKSDETTSLPFTIDNTPPVLASPVASKNGDAWTLSLKGTDATSPLAGAEWRVAAGTAKVAKAGDWQAVAASDGMFDSKMESGVATLDPAMSGTAFKSGDIIEVRIRDAAGNATIAKVTLP